MSRIKSIINNLNRTFLVVFVLMAIASYFAEDYAFAKFYCGIALLLGVSVLAYEWSQKYINKIKDNKNEK